MLHKNIAREVETKSKIGHETDAFLRSKHPICRRGHHEKRSDYTKASWEALSSPPCVRGSLRIRASIRARDLMLPIAHAHSSFRMIDRFLYWGDHRNRKSGKIKGSCQPPLVPSVLTRLEGIENIG